MDEYLVAGFTKEEATSLERIYQQLSGAGIIAGNRQTFIRLMVAVLRTYRNKRYSHDN